MRKLILAIAFAAAALTAVEPALSQVRFQGYGRPRIQRQIKPPPILLIPPSQAARAAQMAVPQGRVISVRPTGRSLYVVKLKQGNRVMRVRVDGATGAVLP